jgi:hypothetical protein
VLQYHFNWKTLSAMAGITWWNFYFRLFPAAIRSPQVILFLTHLLCHIPGSLLIIVAANAAVGLALSQNGGNGLPPGIEDYRLPLPESRVKRRHFLRQIVQGAAAPYIRGPNGYTLNSADQSVDRVLAAL